METAISLLKYEPVICIRLRLNSFIKLFFQVSFLCVEAVVPRSL